MEIKVRLNEVEEELVQKVCTFFGITKTKFIKKCLMEQSKLLFNKAGGDYEY